MIYQNETTMNHDNFTEVTSEDAPYSVQPAYKQGWATGYNTCLERTNAAELLQCLINIQRELEYFGRQQTYNYQRITNAIKKATDEK